MGSTEARTHAENRIEDLRLEGGIFVEAVRATRMAMAVTDPNLPGNPIVFANQSFLKLSGYSMDEVLGQQPHFMNGADTDPDDVARFEEALRNDQDDLVETIQYRKDGTRFVASVLLSAFKDDTGHTTHHFLSSLDVTRRTNAENRRALLQQAQAALRESEKRLSAAFEGVPAGVAAIGLDGVATVTNAEYRRFLPNGIVPSRDPERGDRWKGWDAEGRLLDPQDFPTSRALRGEHVTPGQEMIYTDDEGREIWTNVAAVPTFDDLGNVTGVLTAISDIDERKRAEQALRESERRARTLLAELQHRVRNVLAMMRSMVRRAAVNKRDVPDFVDHLQGRIDAMARTQSALTRAPGRGVDLENIVRDELLAFAAREEGVTVKGPQVLLAPKVAEVLTLAIHELAENSLKYGALGADKDVVITWKVTKRRGKTWLEFMWEERGMPIEDVDPAPGFGTELITQRVPYELEGTSVMTFREDGMTATMSFPLTGEQSVLQTDSGPENWKGGL